ncbi:MAG: RND family transporter [Desulfobacteraceae bacterium]|nr:RND family transporter [Desulfobacteraceae bacterium]
MIKFIQKLNRLYQSLVLDHRLLVIICFICVIALLGYMAREFKIDASSESLLIENDKDLRYARQVGDRFGVNDFLLISFAPKKGDLLSDKNLDVLKRLRDELVQLEQVESAMTILDVPLLQSPPLSYEDLSKNIPSLTTPAVDKKLARNELQQSPFYRELLVSKDMRFTALILNLKLDPIQSELIKKRNTFLDKKAQGRLSDQETIEYEKLVRKIRNRQTELNVIQHQNIKAVRAIMDNYRAEAELFLGGISMIADDMISFIKNDLRVFGLGVFFLLFVMLGFIFKSLRWIMLPMMCCFLSVVAMMGILSAFGWEVTVISSNFISLQLIITLAIVVHLVVRYREFQKNEPDASQRTLVEKTVRSKFIPCLYAALTTIAGFGSLLLCDIKPVIHFGWMMSAGILVSLGLTFILFPSVKMFLKKPAMPSDPVFLKFSFPGFLARFTEANGRAILIITVVVSVFTVMGINHLEVENSFIDYFKQSTEIYKGMEVIDRNLGGTTPLDIIVRFDAVEEEEEDEFFDEDELLLTPQGPQSDENLNKYWFFEHRMETVEQVHDYLNALPETGKVLSLGTILKIGRSMNKGRTLDSLDMAVLYEKLPDDYKQMILAPFVSFENNEARFSIRIKDSFKSLKRNALLKRIKYDLVHKLNLEPEDVRLAGTMVLYNNMLQSLFASQIKTLGFVACALMIMFLVLFRSVKVAFIAIFPNLLSAGFVLAVMGWMNIPLDMMTITIAAISIGIAVDDTIHYIYRFREEIKTDGDYYRAMHRSHASIGNAMYYTSVIIIIGFSILALSNFWPTIYFGLFTGMAMFVALVAALTLLPQLIVLLKPFGPRKL